MQEEDSGDVVAYCVWPKGAETLLPRTDKIALMRTPDDEQPVLADWERVAGVAGDLMKPQDLYPERHRVVEFPSEEQLAAIGGEV